MVYIDSLQSGQRVVGHYLCKDKQTLLTKAGKSYLKLLLQDKTGSVTGMVWDVNERIGEFEKNDSIKIDAMVTLFQGEKQLNISQIRRSRPDEYDPADYCKCTRKDRDQLYNELLERIAGMKNPYLKQLLEHFFPAEGEKREKFMTHPAAKTVHHNYLGGLLEHEESVMRIGLAFCRQYPAADEELVIAGALLHDIGKLRELGDAPLCDYSDEGQLLGHIAMGYLMVHEAAAAIPGFPSELAMQLEHMILSHHGELEYGSPKVPVTLEAMILHLADYSDTKLKQVDEAIREDREQGNWTAYQRTLGRNLYKADGAKE